ncbi:MAG TPA: DUF924 family protein [Thermoanaerobaculia bacterium]|nr:DUF924 family protein [Thermoanaerobaculia bacterium]
MLDLTRVAPGAARVLEFWFGDVDDDGLSPADLRERWFKQEKAFDDEVHERFGATWKRAARRELDHWNESPLGNVALCIVLDQFPRNMFRGEGAMFSSDGLGRAVCLNGINARRDAELVSDLAVFFYMPLMHSEQRADQHLGMRMFSLLVERSPPGAREAMATNFDFMRRHFEIVDRFGRLPHRNQSLDRDSTPEEIEFLNTPGSSF